MTGIPCASQAATELELRLELGTDLAAGPIEVLCTTPSGLAPLPLVARTEDGNWLVIDPASPTEDGNPRGRLRWIAEDSLRAGNVVLRATVAPDWQAPSPFELRPLGTDGDAELQHLGRRVWRRRARFDPVDFEATYKPYHEIFASDGRTLITKGAGGDFPHHRGLFVGWNQTRAERKSYDFWHCREGVHQQRIGGSSRRTPCFAESVDLIEWRDADDRAIVAERRALTTWCVSPLLTVFDVEVGLASAIAVDVVLDGDPQHAGVQLRLAQEVHDRAAATVYSLDPGAVDRGNDVWAECRFAQVKVEVAGHAVTVTHALDESWPTDALYSTRAYGRFGATARILLEPSRETILRTRLVLDCGERDPKRREATTPRDHKVLSARLVVAR
ncbi:MAG: DUF6807 family protein [Planctomycetota bacterium]